MIVMSRNDNRPEWSQVRSVIIQVVINIYTFIPASPCQFSICISTPLLRLIIRITSLCSGSWVLANFLVLWLFHFRWAPCLGYLQGLASTTLTWTQSLRMSLVCSSLFEMPLDRPHTGVKARTFSVVGISGTLFTFEMQKYLASI